MDPPRVPLKERGEAKNSPFSRGDQIFVLEHDYNAIASNSLDPEFPIG